MKFLRTYRVGAEVEIGRNCAPANLETKKQKTKKTYRSRLAQRMRDLLVRASVIITSDSKVYLFFSLGSRNCSELRHGPLKSAAPCSPPQSSSLFAIY